MNFQLLLASNNKHKQEEFQSILDSIIQGQIRLLLPSEVLNYTLEVIEDGLTLEANARKKAERFFEETQIPTIADDTGLEIDILYGKPGVRSARFAGEDCSDADNRKKVLEMMKHAVVNIYVPKRELGNEEQIKELGNENSLELQKIYTNRKARFRTVICYKDKTTSIFLDGICNGYIIEEERGSNGFGYDPIFLPLGFNKTFAEMAPEDKNKISHRRRAIENLAIFMKSKIED